MKEIEIKARIADKVQLIELLEEKGIELSQPVGSFGVEKSQHVADGYDVLMRKHQA